MLLENVPVPVVVQSKLTALVAVEPVMLKLPLPQIVLFGPASTTGKGVTVKTTLSVTVATQGSTLVTVAVRVTVTSETLGVYVGESVFAFVKIPVPVDVQFIVE